MNWPVVAFLVAAPILAAPDWNRQLPRRFPPPSVPADNPIAAEKVQIGRHLLRQADVSKREAVLRELSQAGSGLYRRAATSRTHDGPVARAKQHEPGQRCVNARGGFDRTRPEG
jgi:hypothetical protein